MIRIADVEQVEAEALSLLAAARNARTRATGTRIQPEDERDVLQAVHAALAVLNELADHDRQALPGILFGLEEIGRFIGRGKASVKRLIRDEGLPVSIEGKKFLATKKALTQWQTDRCCSRFGVESVKNTS